MLSKTIAYTDYNGTERVENFLFNLSKPELMLLESSVEGGMGALLQEIVEVRDAHRLMELVKKLVTMSYGVKSNDGRRFVKNDEATESFLQSEAFSELFVELFTDADKMAEFIKGIVPSDLRAIADKQPELKVVPEND